MSKEKKENTQVSLEGLIGDLEKKSQEGFVGLVTEINQITNEDFFGEKGTYGTKDGCAITVKLRDETETEFTQWFSMPDKVTGYKQSNMYLFYKKYGTEPKKGLEITCHLDESGFFRITI